MPPSSRSQPPQPSAATWRTDTLADSVMILLALTVVQRLVGFVRSILFCRWLDPAQLGQWEMAFSFIILAGPLAVLAIPGAFGRYAEHYNQQGQLRTFLRRTIAVCCVPAVAAVTVVYFARSWFSELVFGTPDETRMIVLLAVGLGGTVAFNFLTELFTSLRNVRWVSRMQLANSLAFAALGVCLLSLWECSAASVVVAYGGACLLTAVCALIGLRRVWRSAPPADNPIGHGALWGKMAPFAVWVLLAAVLCNLFEVADRYMILHCSTMAADEALAQVGHYHSSRIVPLLLVAIAAMLATMLTPHLVRDWETGRREQVGAQLRLFLKLVGFGLAAAAVGVLFFAPLLFGVAFKGKYADGLAVLPWTLTYCSWFGLMMIIQTYLWCAEKARLASVALGVGLALNVGLNLVLLPILGLLGAVLATTAANLVALTLVYGFAHLLGFRADRGVVVAVMLPLIACLGPQPALAVLCLVVLVAIRSNLWLTAEEKREITDGCRQYWRRVQSLRAVRRLTGGRPAAQPEP